MLLLLLYGCGGEHKTNSTVSIYLLAYTYEYNGRCTYYLLYVMYIVVIIRILLTTQNEPAKSRRFVDKRQKQKKITITI